MKRKLHFGRVCAVMMATACALSANAQVKLETETLLSLIPSTVTADGKTRLASTSSTGYDDHGLTLQGQKAYIYNKNFTEETSFDIIKVPYSSGSLNEIAKVSVTGVKVTSVNEDYYKEPYEMEYWDEEKNEYVNEVLVASNLEDARTKMDAYLNKGGDSYDSYTVKIYGIDGQSFIHSYSNSYQSSYDYYLYDVFGTQYPKRGYFLGEDGKLYEKSISYTPIYDVSSAVWSVESNDLYEYSENPQKFDYMNADNDYIGSVESSSKKLLYTQTVFNNDSKYEYVIAAHGENIEIKGDPQTSHFGGSETVDSEGKVTLYRTTYYRSPVTSLNIYAQDGTLVGKINANYNNTAESYVEDMDVYDFWVIDGKKYLEIRKYIFYPEVTSSSSVIGLFGSTKSIYELYSIEGGVSNARMILERETAVEPDNTIYDLSGRVLSEKPSNGYYIQGGKTYLAK